MWSGLSLMKVIFPLVCIIVLSDSAVLILSQIPISKKRLEHSCQTSVLLVSILSPHICTTSYTCFQQGRHTSMSLQRMPMPFLSDVTIPFEQMPETRPARFKMKWPCVWSTTEGCQRNKSTSASSGTARNTYVPVRCTQEWKTSTEDREVSAFRLPQQCMTHFMFQQNFMQRFTLPLTWQMFWTIDYGAKPR